MAKINLKTKSLTIMELLIVLAIMGALFFIGTVGYERMVENERAHNAWKVLYSIWQAEQSYFAWHNDYTQDWAQLNLPLTVPLGGTVGTDTIYTYTLTLESNEFATAERIDRPAAIKYSINEAGECFNSADASHRFPCISERAGAR